MVGSVACPPCSFFVTQHWITSSGSQRQGSTAGYRLSWSDDGIAEVFRTGGYLEGFLRSWVHCFFKFFAASSCRMISRLTSASMSVVSTALSVYQYVPQAPKPSRPAIAQFGNMVLRGGGMVSGVDVVFGGGMYLCEKKLGD